MALDWAEPTSRRGRFYRATSGKWIAGVCAGIAARWNVNPLWLRAALVLTVVYACNMFTALAILLYIALAIVMKPNPAQMSSNSAPPNPRASTNQAPPPEPPPFQPGTRLATLSAKFATLEARLAKLEAAVTNTDIQLRRNFRDLGA